MDSINWKRAKQIFNEALEKSGPEREAYVAAACGEEPELRAQVEALLAAHEEAGSFLAAPTAPRAEDAPEAPTTATRLPPAERPGAMIGPYKLLQVIGEGGFGVVYMAEQERPLRRRVALKIIKLGMDTAQVIARFEAERQALALMDHPNIAKVLDAGATETGRPYFVMELVKGVSLTEYCDANRLSTRERLDLFTRICSAVQHAHQKGVIHRDIKPSNVMVTLHDGEPVPKVIDFGIAKATHQRLTEKTLFTRYGQFVGTPAYMSPEQAEMSGLDVDTRTDIYALGVLLYELLTGTTPFDARTLREAAYVEIQRIIREEEPPRPSTRLSTLGGALTAVARQRGTDARGLARLVRGDLDWIVMKALEKDRGRRYDSASGLAEDIARHLGGEPVLARPPSAAYKLRKLVRKHRGPVAAVAAVVVTALLLGSVAFWQGLRAQRQATRVRATSLLASALETDDPLLKALLTFELEDAPDLPGRLNVARQAADHPLPTAVLRGHGGFITSAAFSPDGSRLATGALDATARVWPLDGAGEPVVLRGPAGQVWDVAFSPDGRFVLTAYLDGTARVWRADGTGEPVVLEGHQARLWSAAFSPDGTHVVTASADRTARVWRADGTGEPVVLRGHEKGLRTAIFDADGSRVLTSSYDGTARVWRADGTGDSVILKHDDWVWRAAFSPDGKQVVTASKDGTARVWRADGTGDVVILKHEDAVWDAAFSPDGKRVVTASGDWTARVWQADGSGDPVILRGHEDTVWKAAFSPDGERVITASHDGTARLWQEGREPVVLGRHEGWVLEAAFSPDGSQIVTASADGTARLWRADDAGEALVLRGHPNDVVMSLFSPDGSSLLTAGEDVRVWQADGRGAPVVLGERAEWQLASFSPDGTRVLTTTKQGKVRVWRADGRGDPVALDEEGASRAEFDPDGDRVVTANRDGVARVWRADGSAPPVELRGHEAMLFGSRFSPDGDRVVTSSADGTIRVWQADGTGDPVVLRSQVPGPVYSSGFSPDGSQVLATAGDFSRGYLWPADGSGEPVVLRRPDGSVHLDDFSPDGTRVVGGSWDGPVMVWKLDRPDDPIVLRGHTSEVWVTEFSPGGDRVASASGDGTARVWKADGTGEPLVLRHGEQGEWVTGVAFSPDGTRAVTSSWDETARIWRITWPELLEYLRERVTTCLTPEQRVKYLAESESEARSAYAACERSHGRNPGAAAGG